MGETSKKEQDVAIDHNSSLDEKNRAVETEEVSNRVYREKVGGAVQVMPGKEAAASPDSKPSWMEEFSRKKASVSSDIAS